MMEVLRLNNEEKNKQQGIVKLFVLKQFKLANPNRFSNFICSVIFLLS